MSAPSGQPQRNTMNLAVIPARKGSKGLTDKNITLLRGKPLIIYTIEAALECDFLDKVVVTTDSDEIADICSSYCSIILRPDKLGVDEIPLAPVIIHAFEKAELRYDHIYKTIFTLQPTSPLRTSKHIKEAFKRYNTVRCNSLLSVTEELHSIWEIDRGVVTAINYPTINRQYMKPIYIGNGAIFITQRHILLEHKDRINGEVALYVMDKMSSIDIHTREDIELAEYYLEKTE